MSSFFSRLAVSLAGLPIVLGAAWAGGWGLFVLIAVAGLVALHELYRVARQLRPLVLAGYAGALAILLGTQLGGVRWMGVGFVVALLLAFSFAAVADTGQSNTAAIGVTVLGVAWVAFGLAHAILLRDVSEHERLAIFAVLLGVFAIDTAAYGVGRVVGRHKLAPRMSPGKTWEGFVAGAGAGIFVTWVALYRADYVSGWQSLVLGVAIVLSATVGDLLESMVKRDLGVKDMGSLLASHGGIIDRIDSLLLALPTAYYVLLAFDAA